MSHTYLRDPDRSISEGPPLALEAGLGTLTLSGFLAEVTARFADREALVHTDDRGEVERWSYSDLWQQSMAVARSLLATGLSRGERVGILMTNRAEFLSATFGVALAGGVATPISTFSTPTELDYLLSLSAVSVLLFEGQVLKQNFAEQLCALEVAVAESAPGALRSLRFPYLRRLARVDSVHTEGAIESWSDFLSHGDSTAPAFVEHCANQVQPADPGVLFFSSGSTAKPKGIVSAHRGVSVQMWRMGSQQALDDGVRSWTANGFFWSGNFAMIVGGTLGRGGSLVLQRTFHADEALQLMARERVTFLFSWPHQWEQLIASPEFATVDLSSLVHLDPNTPIAQHPTVNTSWLQPTYCYGNTETFTLSTGFPANTTKEAANDSHGLPFPGNTIKIVDPLTGEILPLGGRGEIAVKGPTLMLGYLGVPLDDSLDAQGFFRTGDGGWLDEHGRLYWEGRLNDIIKTGGANVSPFEIDEAIMKDAAVRLSHTVGVPHESLGEMVVSCLVLHAGFERDEDAVRAQLKSVLASYKIPRRVLFFSADELSVTGSAKVKSADVRALAEQTLLTEDQGPS